jgi:hypothetical protein
MINRVTDYLPADRTQRHRDGHGHFSFSDVNVQQWIQPAEEVILKYPAACLASAFVVGVAVAWWIKRK